MDSRAIAHELQCVLVELIGLSLTSKHAHCVLGRPLFEPLSLELADLADDAWGWADSLDARLAGMGVAADGRAGTVAEQVRSASFPVGFVDDAEAVAPIMVRLTEIIEEGARRSDTVREADPVSEDLLISLVAGLVKHRWVLASHESGESSPIVVAARRPRTVRG